MQCIVSSAMYSTLPADVQIMASALAKIQQSDECIVDVDNCGTAMRFLTAYAATQVGKTITLTGCERMCMSRPIGTLAVVLRELGASIEYLGKPGYPPLRIEGKCLDMDKKVSINNAESTQFISALMLIGANVETSVVSPYIDMTRALLDSGNFVFERDWSAAAFWYERVALGMESEVFFPGLSLRSLQGDKAAAAYFAYFGVETQEDQNGIRISCAPLACSTSPAAWAKSPNSVVLDLTHTPDLYPALTLTCYLLKANVHWVLPENLRIKESDRIAAMQNNIAAMQTKGDAFVANTYHDHRIAMTFIAAGYAVDDTACIAKSYPDFTLQIDDRR